MVEVKEGSRHGPRRTVPGFQVHDEANRARSVGQLMA